MSIESVSIQEEKKQKLFRKLIERKKKNAGKQRFRGWTGDKWRKNGYFASLPAGISNARRLFLCFSLLSSQGCLEFKFSSTTELAR